MRREDSWLRPKPDAVIKTRDILISASYAEGEEDLRRLASGKSTRVGFESTYRDHLGEGLAR